MVLARYYAHMKQYFHDHPCEHCGEDDPIVLQLHHVRGVKKDTVRRVAKQGYAWDKVLKELAKCDTLCANCHIRETAKLGKFQTLEHYD